MCHINKQVIYVFWRIIIINKMKRDIVLFMPSIDKGGVEKNFFLISNYLANYNSKIKVITISKNLRIGLTEKLNL